MQKEIIIQLNKTFEESVYTQKGVEYWMARDLQKLLDYDEWRNFLKVIDKARLACSNSGQNMSDHFVDVNKTIPMPKGAEKDIQDIMLTRYACYLIAQNGDPRKEQIAFAQSYFAIQTRRQELLEERIALVERLRAREKLADTESIRLRYVSDFLRIIASGRRCQKVTASAPVRRQEKRLEREATA